MLFVTFFNDFDASLTILFIFLIVNYKLTYHSDLKNSMLYAKHLNQIINTRLKENHSLLHSFENNLKQELF